MKRQITAGDGQSVSPERVAWIKDRATRFVISQGYGQETANDFAQWAIAYFPEIQGFANLFDYYVDNLTA